MRKNCEVVHLGKDVDNAEIIKYIKSFKYTIIWGCSFLGIPVGKNLLENGVNITNYWDIRSDELVSVNGINVVLPFTCPDKENTLVIICIGNNHLRSELAEKLKMEDYKNIMCDEDLHSLYKIALEGEYKYKYKYKGDVNPLKMSCLERIEKAVDYAIDTDYKIWNRQFNAIEYLRMSENICIFGDEEFSKFCKTYHFENNGINNIKFICNTNIENHGKTIDGMHYISMDQFAKLKSPTVIIQDSTSLLPRQLDEMNINYYFFGDLVLNVFTPHYNGEWFSKQKDAIIATYHLFEDDESKNVYVEKLCNCIAPHLATKTFKDLQTPGEYFSHGIFELSKTECFVDAGAYIGDSIDSFMDAVNQKFDQIYSFELDYGIYMKLEKNVSKYDVSKIKLFNKGVYDKNTRICYAGSGDGMYISNNANNFGEVVKLDDILKNKKITLIKMDVEGSEMAALVGANNIISSQKPKLAISAYHKLSDLWEIPIYLKTLNNDYKIYLRHHSQFVWDSDFYAY